MQLQPSNQLLPIAAKQSDTLKQLLSNAAKWSETSKQLLSNRAKRSETDLPKAQAHTPLVLMEGYLLKPGTLYPLGGLHPKAKNPLLQFQKKTLFFETLLSLGESFISLFDLFPSQGRYFLLYLSLLVPAKINFP